MMFKAALLLLFVFALFVPTAAHAQEVDLGFATYVPIKDTTIEDGSVIITTQDGLYLSRYPYDDTISGVVTLKPAVVLGLKKEGTYPLNTKGNAAVRVSTINGPITTGDLLTSSTIPGVAMRATKSGTIVGAALGDYSSQNPNEIGKIPVLIEIKFNENGVTKSNGSEAFQITSLRVIMGSIVAVITTILCFIFFGRYTSKGIEALGRNPLASKTIKRNMLLQGILFLILLATGYSIAYFLLRA
jgi:hypothetical protein